jgi:hypothetical protein
MLAQVKVKVLFSKKKISPSRKTSQLIPGTSTARKRVMETNRKLQKIRASFHEMKKMNFYLLKIKINIIKIRGIKFL